MRGLIKSFKLAISLSFIYMATASGPLYAESDKGISLQAIDFVAVNELAPAWYVDQERRCLAVDAMKFKERFAKVKTTFEGVSGDYKVRLVTLTEVDGESQYEISIGTKSLGILRNPESDVDFEPYNHAWSNVRLNHGEVIMVAFSSTTNGKIPEGDATAYSRGRWTKLELECLSCKSD